MSKAEVVPGMALLLSFQMPKVPLSCFRLFFERRSDKMRAEWELRLVYNLFHFNVA
jgi:hypothetical protein